MKVLNLMDIKGEHRSRPPGHSGDVNLLWWHLMFVSPVWNLLYVTLLAPRILGRIQDFCTHDGYDVHFVVTDVL